MHNHESTITSAFVDILRPMRATWKVHEEVCPYRSARLRPDVFITEEGRKPIPIEIKIDDDDEGESQARKHLGQILGDAYDAALAENASQLKLFADEDAAYQTQASAVGSTSVPSPAAVGGGGVEALILTLLMKKRASRQRLQSACRTASGTWSSPIFGGLLRMQTTSVICCGARVRSRVSLVLAG